MTDAELIEKLKRFEETCDHAERHSLALELADNSDPRIFNVLVRLIQRPDLENRRGTLIYCLEAHDCASIKALLEDIARTGNFEAGMQAEIILDDQRLR
ncbi:hypothetical protein [Novosphingobium nitrogenifigens]|uniref:hypothetical protein n=1 Tax=Novosphingobium nitrogenifigens TaxID=378548 RepID=UPI000379C003|nr:hypothetical protein [Novosphingobium nitrogenifigens]